MGLKKVVVIIPVIVALGSYWLYAPLPPGFSFESRKQFQLMSIGMKMINVVTTVGSYLGFGTKNEIYINIVRKMMKDHRPKVTVEGVVTSESSFDGVPVRIYKPSDAQDETLPGIVYYHGGGFTLGNIDSVDAITRHLCRDTRSVVVSVEYRLAPEFPFPAAFDDCAAATKYFLSNAADFNVDSKRIAVSGDSAGGNLAATVSLQLRNENFPIPIKLQVLIYPVVQMLDFSLPSILKNRDGPLINRKMMPFFTAMYTDGNENRIPDYAANSHVIKSYRDQIAKTFLNLDKLPTEFLVGYEKPEYPEGDEKIWNEIKGKMLNPYHSPLTAENVENLPEAFVFTATYDPLRDEGYLYGIKLREAKNKVTLYNEDVAFHGILNFVGVQPEADAIFAKITKFIKEKL